MGSRSTLQGLTVFISSSIAEFGNLRVRLKNEIERIGFLSCVVLEDEGARPVPVERESLDRAADSDIFVAIFGAEFSELTAKEYRKARENDRPCYVYVLRDVSRHVELSRFISEEVKKVVKYQEFGNSAELIEFVSNDLTNLMGRVLREGMKNWNLKLAPATRKKVNATVESPNRSKPYQDILQDTSKTLTPQKQLRLETEKEYVRLISNGPQWIRILGALRDGSSQSSSQLTRATGIYGAILWFRLRDMTIGGLIDAPHSPSGPVYKYSITERGVNALLSWLLERREREWRGRH